MTWWSFWISDQNFSYFWSTSRLDTTYQVSIQLAFSFRRRSSKIDFQNGGRLVFRIYTILAILDVQVARIFPFRFRVKWPFRSGEEAQNKSQQTHDVYTMSSQRRCNVMTLHRRWDDVVWTSCARWKCLSWWPSWISNRNEKVFLIYQSSQYFLWNIGLSVQEKKFKIYFQDGGHGGHLEFSIGTILAFLIYRSSMLPAKFQVNLPFGSGEESQNRFSRLRPSWISDQKAFSYFLSTSHLYASYQSYESIGLLAQEKKRK